MEQAQQKAAMTLREQCEQVMTRLVDMMLAAHMESGVAITYDVVALKVLERFAKQQQAVGLREAAEAYRKWLPSTIPKAGDWRPPQAFDEWCEQQARELENAQRT